MRRGKGSNATATFPHPTLLSHKWGKDLKRTVYHVLAPRRNEGGVGGGVCAHHCVHILNLAG